MEVLFRGEGEARRIYPDVGTLSWAADTDVLFETPSRYDVRVTADGAPIFWADKICQQLLPAFDPKAPTINC